MHQSHLKFFFLLHCLIPYITRVYGVPKNNTLNTTLSAVCGQYRVLTTYCVVCGLGRMQPDRGWLQ